MELKKATQAGFSVIEMLVVIMVIGVLSVSLISTFRDSSTNANARHLISSVLLADIRRAQSLALSGSQYQGQIVCGYGIHYENAASYSIFAGIRTGGGSRCANHPHKWRGADLIVETRVVANDKFEVIGPGGGAFRDVFFEPPDPKTYLDGNYSLTASPLFTNINVVAKGQSCLPTNCTTITVHTSGRIDVTN